MPDATDDPLTATAEYAGDDAGYAWWRHTHPSGYVLAVRARHEPVLHRAACAATCAWPTAPGVSGCAGCAGR